MNPNQNSSGMMNGMPPIANENKKIGPILGLLVIILVIIIASLYFFGKKLNTTPSTETPIETVTPVTPVSEDSSAAAIDAELDAQLEDIDYSF